MAVRPGYPAASRADIDYLLAKVNAMLRDPLDRGDIEGVFAGLRPLVRPATAATPPSSAASTPSTRRAPGLTVIAGGKYTTYRVMARDLIDAAAGDLGRPASRRRVLSDVPLARARPGTPSAGQARERLAAAQRAARRGRSNGCSAGMAPASTTCSSSSANGPSSGSLWAGSGGYLAAEIVYACTHEGAVRLDDVLARRTRIAIEMRDRDWLPLRRPRR